MPTVDYGARADRTLERIQNSEAIHPDNKTAIQDFKRDLSLEDMSDGWLSKLLGHLVIMAEYLGETRFEDMDKDDVKDLVEWAQDRKKRNGDPLSQATVNAYKQVIKRFWRWLYGLPSGEHPEMTDWVNTGSDTGNGKLPKGLLERDDIYALKDGSRNDRDRAFIAILYETGARMGELIDLTVGDIEDNDHGRKVVIDGKTGERRLPLVECVPALNDWISDHPSPRDDAPLWSKLQTTEGLSYKYIREKILGRAGKRAAKADPERFAADPSALNDEEKEIDFHKPLNPHHFRHSRATDLASKDEFNEYKLCQWFGWVVGSNVPARYVHLSGKDIDDAYNRMHGLEVAEDDEEEETVVECPRCEELNEPGAVYCMRCAWAIDPDRAEAAETRDDEAIKNDYRDTSPDDLDTMDKLDLIDDLLNDPEIKALRAEREAAE